MEKKKKKVIVAGHICLDITPVFFNQEKTKVQTLLKPGRLIQMDEADIHSGGCVANTGLAMKILGADVSLMGKIGEDAFGKIILNILGGYQAEKGMIVARGESTSYSVVLAIPGVDRIFLHHSGANDSFSAEDIPAEALKDAALFHFGYPPLMRNMYEKDGEELEKVLRLAKQAGAAVSLDMAAVDADAPSGKADWKKILKRVLPLVDFFVPSVEELCFMLDRERISEWQTRAGGGDVTEFLDVEKDVRPLAEQCMDMGAKVLLIKCGAPGLYCRTAEEEVLKGISGKLELDAGIWAGKEGFEKSYMPEKVLSGTGAGDTSIAAFLCGVLEGYGPETCIKLAAATGASCVEAYDALSGLKSFEELFEKMKKGWKKREG